MGDLGEKLHRFYSIFPWYDDPESEGSKRYFEATLASMGELVRHPWLGEAVAKGTLKVLEVCGGAGFGGVALAKVLAEKGTTVELTVTDLRREALDRARRWGTETLGHGVRTRAVDARRVHELGEEYDLVLMYGLSTPHFDPWDLVRL